MPGGSLWQRPDGSFFTPGDSIEITLTLDTTQILVRLEPTRLAFNAAAPAHLTIWYSGANPDLNGDGIVDLTDAYIEQTLLGLWVRDGPLAPWNPVSAVQSLLSKLFSADLGHFSEYALSW